jgi:hypothetical protein
MTSQDRLTLEETLATFDEHLRRTRVGCQKSGLGR